MGSLFLYGFSLFKMSTQRVGILNYNPPASRVVTIVIRKNHLQHIIRITHMTRIVKPRLFIQKINARNAQSISLDCACVRTSHLQKPTRMTNMKEILVQVHKNTSL